MMKYCAIVGNSGSLLNNEYGPLIDEHYRVVRFNVAPTKGFEKYVGYRTKTRFIAHNKAYDYSGLENDFILLYSYSFRAATEAYNKLKLKNEVHYLTEDFIQSCDNMIGKPHWKWWLKQKMGMDRMIIHKTMSTTGLKAIMYWLPRMPYKNTERDRHQISLFGFLPDKQFHYYEENRPGYKPTDSHDFEKEMQIIKGFEREGKLKIWS